MGIQKTTQCASHASRPSTSRRSSMSKSSALQSHLPSYIRICVDHSPCLPPLAFATISYSSMITHGTPLFGSSKIRSRKHAPLPTIRIIKRKWERESKKEKARKRKRDRQSKKEGYDIEGPLTARPRIPPTTTPITKSTSTYTHRQTSIMHPHHCSFCGEKARVDIRWGSAERTD
jgi:hypothetical protein